MIRVFILLCCLMLACVAQAAQVERMACPARFVTALAYDNTGGIWVGTEDEGAYRISSSMDTWRRFTAKDGLADENVYAIATDREGRVWCGTLNHGVSVYNGEVWRNYDVSDGPLGERIFSIACSPQGGDVWIASSRGLSHYRAQEKVWNFITRMNGLPDDQVESIAFTAQGDLIAGLQCGGIARLGGGLPRLASQSTPSQAKGNSPYPPWEHTLAPWYADKSQFNPYTLEPEGEGLPSNLVNDVLVARDGTVWVATVGGVAWRSPNARNWRFLRGLNYAARMKGIYGGPPKDWPPPPKETEDRLLPEDYVSCLAEGADGKIWMGFREKGCAVFNPKTLTFTDWIRPGNEKDITNMLPGGYYVRKLLPLPDGRMLVGGYGGGLLIITPLGGGQAGASILASPRQGGGDSPRAAELPPPAKPPTDAQLTSLTQRLDALRSKSAKAKTATYLGEDWTTQGDAIRRYGRRHAMFCAMNAPLCNYTHNYDFQNYPDCDGRLGPTAWADDDLRHWVHWIKTDNPRSLFYPGSGLRRQSEWDDHGEEYPRATDGPDVWIAVKLPEGTQRLSLYINNKDGHDGANRHRDYLIEVREYQSSLPEKAVFSNTRAEVDYNLPKNARSLDLTNAIPRAVLARTRVKDFWGGVYKSFAIQGPGVFYVRIARHGSHNTIVSGVFVDKIPDPRATPENPPSVLRDGGVLYESPDPSDAGKRPDLVAAAAVWEGAQDICGFVGGAEAYIPARVLAYRQAFARKAPENLLGNWRWHLGIWTDSDRQTFTEKMAEVWEAKQQRESFLRSAEFRPYSPNVIPFSTEECHAMRTGNIDLKAYIPPGKHYKVEVTTNRFPILYELFGTTNVTRGTRLLTPLRKLQNDEERWPDTNAAPRVLALVRVKNALSAVEQARHEQVTEEVLKETETLMVSLLRVPLQSVGQEAENTEALIRHLKLLLSKGRQEDARFAWFHIKARLNSLKAQKQTRLYTDFLAKLKALPLGAREKKELAEF